MSDVIAVSAEWLTLREQIDAGSRSVRLAREAARLVEGPVVVHDLGSGTGSMMRWLAPSLPGPQTWVLHDWNAELLARASAQPGADVQGRSVAVEESVEHAEHLLPEDLAGASLVTASALLDVLTRDELDAVVDACAAVAAPALFSLSVTGRVRLDPADPGDGVFEAAFNDHQRRLAGSRHLLGPDAPAAAAAAFRRAGWVVRLAESPWRLTANDHAVTAAWLEGWVAAAIEQRPTLLEWGDEYLLRRMRQLTRGELRVVVQHLDLLAHPA
ncbi:SAM-dependent methyltransferase [Microbacterium sp. BK668]|uniref:methyltransferase domain-containing protein n=1 Tax=Microbacterium sp. BK668 TaxID=2512118 RepID=UPI00105B5C6E|nr:SAM-dependent methyltransferase [Microbacterium sp. BK668]TDN91692.1 hypothetical protein EV279_1195 [Microbacterium sp. BK668]